MDVPRLPRYWDRDGTRRDALPRRVADQYTLRQPKGPGRKWRRGFDCPAGHWFQGAGLSSFPWQLRTPTELPVRRRTGARGDPSPGDGSRGPHSGAVVRVALAAAPLFYCLGAPGN